VTIYVYSNTIDVAVESIYFESQVYIVPSPSLLLKSNVHNANINEMQSADFAPGGTT